MGRTSQKRCIRINQHRSNVTREYQKYSVSRHAASHHECNFNTFSLLFVDNIPMDARNRNELLARREMYWIFKLDILMA